MRQEPPAKFIEFGLRGFSTTAKFQRIVYPAVRWDRGAHVTSRLESRAIDVLFMPKVVRLRCVKPGRLPQ